MFADPLVFLETHAGCVFPGVRDGRRTSVEGTESLASVL